MELTDKNELIINGKKYIQKPRRESKSRISQMIQAMLMMSSALMMHDPFSKKPKERPKVDIIAEYDLIQQKKSKLSRSNREWVVSEFRKHFIEVK